MTGRNASIAGERDAAPKLRVLELFAGIGGFSLGLERTGGFETVAFCEIDAFCRKVLAKHWPSIPCHEDVTKLRGEDVGPVDVITGGFPCQDISLAGPGEGLNGKRSGLWREFARLIGELRPDYIIVENVAALLGRGLGRVLGDLAALGYDAEWHCIPASYVGARQLRDRIWIVASPQRDGFQGGANIAAAWRRQSREEQLAGLVQPCAWPTVSSARDCGTGHGIPDGIHRNRALGNAVVPQIPELIGNAILAADTPDTRRLLPGASAGHPERQPVPGGGVPSRLRAAQNAAPCGNEAPAVTSRRPVPAHRGQSCLSDELAGAASQDGRPSLFRETRE